MKREMLMMVGGGAAAIVLIALLALGASTSSRPIEAFSFYLFGGLAVGASVAIVLTESIVRAAAWLLAALVACAGLYFLLAANFLAVIQLIVYAGGILVLIVFGILLTARSAQMRFTPSLRERGATLLAVTALFVGMVSVLLSAPWPALPTPRPALEATETRAIGRALLTDYLLPFEVLSVLLLAAMIGAAYLARPVRR